MSLHSSPEPALTVDLGDRSYPIFVGANLLDKAGDLLKPILRQPRTFLISDENVAPLYLDRVRTSLTNAGFSVDALVVPAGESTKSFDHLEQVVDALLTAKVERSTAALALGGGVIGDLTGFASAVALRGMDFIQLPTTLLAQVDSSVGGKTGINTRHGKNLVGSFYQPKAVIADIGSLETLPDRELLAGYAEVCKYGLLGNDLFWTWLESNGKSVLAGNAEALSYAVEASCAEKARIVSEDERENGVRALLNLGHTFAHALEAEFGYSRSLLHGEAVAIGMIIAFSLSVRLGLCPQDDADRVRAHFDTVGLPTSLNHTQHNLDASVLVSHMAHDKKVKDGAITFVLVRGIGQAFLTQDVPAEDVTSVLEQTLAA